MGFQTNRVVCLKSNGRLNFCNPRYAVFRETHMDLRKQIAHSSRVESELGDCAPFDWMLVAVANEIAKG